MNKNLLIVGAGIYGSIAKEIAESMNCFERISFIDDGIHETSNGIAVIGTCADIKNVAAEYSNFIVAIGAPEIRLSLLREIEEKTSCKAATLISPRAYVAPSARIMKGSIIEPMAVVHAGSLISIGCIISAGAVVNHTCMCCDGAHIDCNATVAAASIVPAGSKVDSGVVFGRRKARVEDLLFDQEEWAKRLEEIIRNSYEAV